MITHIGRRRSIEPRGFPTSRGTTRVSQCKRASQYATPAANARLFTWLLFTGALREWVARLELLCARGQARVRAVQRRGALRERLVFRGTHGGARARVLRGVLLQARHLARMI